MKRPANDNWKTRLNWPTVIVGILLAVFWAGVWYGSN